MDAALEHEVAITASCRGARHARLAVTETGGASPDHTFVDFDNNLNTTVTRLGGGAIGGSSFRVTTCPGSVGALTAPAYNSD